MITHIDDNFHRLEQQLEELGLKENTLLIFMTDNGTALGHTVFDAGLRGHKGSEYEGGHRVPFMVRWPRGKIGGGRKVEQLAAHFDLLPTLVDVLGLEYDGSKSMDGLSLKPLLYGETEGWPNRILYVDTQRGLELVKYKQYSVMNDPWRLVNGNELYNLQEDLGQTRNLINEYPEVAARLAGAYEHWWKSIVEEGVEDRFAYLKAGSPRENPLRICSHDMRTPLLDFWHQYGAVQAAEGSGIWKVEIVEGGEYEVSLRRFPRESGLAINARFAASPRLPELEHAMPASQNPGFVEASLFMGKVSQSAGIETAAEEVTFSMHLQAGKYDMEAILKDQHGGIHPAYFVYIERIK